MSEEKVEKKAPKASADKKDMLGSALELKGLGIVGWLVILPIAGYLFFVSPYALLFLILGMSPTIVAGLTDKRYGSCASRTVGALNFMGLLPFIFDFFQDGVDKKAIAKEITTTPSVWLFVYGAAFIGWGLIWVIPQITAAIFNVRAQNKIERIQNLQQHLVDEWGREVAGKTNDYNPTKT